MIRKVILLLLIIAVSFPVFPVLGAGLNDPYEGFSLSAFDETNATNYAISDMLGRTGANQWYRYDSIDFGDISPNSVEINVGCDASSSSGKILLRVDAADGPIIAEFTIDEPKGWGVKNLLKSTILHEVTGVRSVYLCTRPGACDYYDVTFIQPPDISNVYIEYDGGADAYSDISTSAYRDDINTLTALGFNFSLNSEEVTFPSVNNGKLYPDSFITRGKFADLLSVVLNSNIDYDTQVFADVPDTYKYFNQINAVYKQGYMQGDGNGNFNPESFMSVTDAAVTMCRLLSYTPFAEANGGYPMGYRAIAQREGLLDGLNAYDTLTIEATAHLFMNVLKADFYDVSRYTNAGEGEYTKLSDGILSQTRNIYMGTGVVNATNVTHINKPGSELEGNAVLIDGNKYSCGKTMAAGLLGYACEYFYEKMEDENILIHIMPVSSTKEVKLASYEDEIISVSTSSIKYTENGHSDIKELKTGDCHIVYNGVALDALLSEIVTFPFKGEIKYVNNKTAKDVLFIDEYKNIRIEGFVSSDTAISDAVSGKTYSFNEDEYILRYTKDGLPTKVSSKTVINGDVGVLYRSVNRTGKKLARLIVDDNVVSGTVSKYMSQDTAVINNRSYKVDTNALSALELTNITAGLTARYYCNIYDEIVYYDLSLSTSTQLGFLMNYTISDPSSFMSKIMLRIVNSSNQKEVLEMAKSCKVDGVRMKDTEAIAEYFANAEKITSVENTPIRYRLNNENQVVMIDTLVEQSSPRGSNLDDLMVSVGTYGNTLNWVPRHSVIRDKTGTDKMVLMGADDIKLFSQLEDEDDWGFFALTKFQGNAFEGTAYSYDLNKEIVNVVVSPTNPATAGVISRTMLVFNETRLVLDEEDEVQYEISGYINGVEKNYIVGKDSVKAQIDMLKKGDYIYFVPDGDEIKDSITVIMFKDGCKQRTENGTTLSATLYYEADDANGVVGESSGQGQCQFLLGIVTEKYGEHIKVEYKEANQDSYSYFKISNTSVLATSYYKERDILSGVVRGIEVKEGDVVCITTSDSANYCNIILDNALAEKIK